jgi:hypothetical protein
VRHRGSSRASAKDPAHFGYLLREIPQPEIRARAIDVIAFQLASDIPKSHFAGSSHTRWSGVTDAVGHRGDSQYSRVASSWVEAVPVVNGRDPSAPRSAPTADAGWAMKPGPNSPRRRLVPHHRHRSPIDQNIDGACGKATKLVTWSAPDRRQLLSTAWHSLFQLAATSSKSLYQTRKNRCFS